MTVRSASLTLAIWLAAAAASIVLALSTDAFPTNLVALVSNLEAARAERIVARHFTGEQSETVLYCVRESDAESGGAAGDEALSLSQACAGGDSESSDPPEIQAESSGFLSATPRTLILRGIDLARAPATGSEDHLQPGPATVDDRLARDLRRVELWSLVLTATALLLTYRSIPVAVATFAFGAIVVAVTWGVLTLAAQAISLPFVVVSVASLLALALGADLASLAYATWRSGGRSNGRAAAIACCGVLAAFLPLAVLPPSGLRAIVVGAATAAAVAYAGSRTAIPSAIHLISRWVQPSGAGTAVHSGPIARAAGAAARAPLVTLVIVIALLLPLCVAGFGELRAPKSTVPVDPATTLSTIRTSLASDTERVLRGTIEFVIEEPRTPETIAAIAAMLDEIAQRPAFSAPVFVQWSVDGQVAVVTAFVTDERGLSALQAAESVRDASPQLAPYTVIGGPVMLGAQIDDILQAWSLWSSVAATLLAFLVLAVGFHALLLAALAIGGAAISAVAALGVVAWMVERGVEVGPFQIDAQAGLDPWAPLIVTCIVIAASTSFASLVIRQYRQHATGRRASVAYRSALADNPQLTTAAAVSMIAVGIGFTSSGVTSLQQAGLGLAVALAIEATIIRALLIPIVLELVDRATGHDISVRLR